MAATIGTEALIPNPALAPFAPLVGEWRTTGTHPMVPGTQFHGRVSFGWHEGGAFLIMRSEIDEPEIPSGVAIFASDDAAGTFFQSYFDERGISRRYEVTVDGTTVTWHRDEAGFAQRWVLEPAADGGTMTGTGQMARDGGPWEPDLSLTYVREP